MINAIGLMCAGGVIVGIALLLWDFTGWLKTCVQCRLCKEWFAPKNNLIDRWDAEWVHCPSCLAYGKPDDSIGASGCRLEKRKDR